MQRPRENWPFHGALVVACAALLIAATPLVAQQVTGAGVPAEASAGVRALSWPGPADHVALILGAMRSAAGTTPTVAQPVAGASAPADANASLPGPRVRPEVRGVEPRIADGRATAWAPPPPANHTIVISTLALVLIAVIVTILVVK